MAIGSRYWASSFVTLKNGKKYYLSNSLYNLKRQMNSKNNIIKIETSNLYSKTYIIKKEDIELYGNC